MGRTSMSSIRKITSMPTKTTVSMTRCRHSRFSAEIGQFFRNSGFDDDYPEILGPGLYSRVQDFSIRDNDMSCFAPFRTKRRCPVIQSRRK